LAEQTSCVPCVKGEYNDVESAATCKLCKADSYSVDNHRTTECISCATGRSAVEEGSTSCSDCLAGKFEETTNTGEEICSTCSPGNYTDASNLKVCKQCPIGYAQSSSKQTSCVECSPGEFNDVAGAVRCKFCLNMEKEETAVASTVQRVGLPKTAVPNAPCVALERTALDVNFVHWVMLEKETTMMRLNVNNVNWVKQQRQKVPLNAILAMLEHLAKLKVFVQHARMVFIKTTKAKQNALNAH
jgi:hypothetical protein